MEETPSRRGNLAVGVLFVFLAIAIISLFLSRYRAPVINLVNRLLNQQEQSVKPEIGFKRFTSSEEFSQYLSQNQQLQDGNNATFGSWIGTTVDMAAPMVGGKEQQVERISDTNVQVKGIDEPDIFKTNGRQLFAFVNGFYQPQPMIDDTPAVRENESQRLIPGFVPPPPTASGTLIANAFPPQNLAKLSELKEGSELLLTNNTLIIINQQKISAYDVTEPTTPEFSWVIDFDSRTDYVSARLMDNQFYLVTKTSVSIDRQCPIELFSLNGQTVSLDCNRIYHPVEPVAVDSTYSIMRINPATGQTEDSIEFVAPFGQTIVYMTETDIFVSYNFQSNVIKFLASFFEENTGLIPATVAEKITSLEKLDISQAAKMTEMGVIWQNFLTSMTDDDRLKLENDLQNKIKTYEEEHLRQLEQTAISRVSLLPMEFKATGLIPGRLLNQFSLDYYQDHLRVATTIQSNWWLPGIRSSQLSLNDLYVLDENLNQVGSLLDLGRGERIYSVRFMDDLGYMVTFKQIDPFFVFDLSKPTNPQTTGELKIPGYSSYLHQLKPGLILGVGKDDNQVKLSLFDVNNLNNPQEIDKYFLTEYYSEILDNHHAFLLDEDNQIFFIPGREGGYVFSYQDQKLDLKKAIADISAKRALYLNNYLYVLGEEKIVVYDMASWEEINRLVF